MTEPTPLRTAAALLRLLTSRALALVMLMVLVGAWNLAHAVPAAMPDREWASLLLVESIDHPAALNEVQDLALACRKPAPSKSLAIDQVLKEIADKDAQPLATACWQTLRQAARRALRPCWPPHRPIAHPCCARQRPASEAVSPASEAGILVSSLLPVG